MKKANAELAGALVRMENDRDFQTFKAWVESSFKDELIGNLDLGGEEAVRGQGRAQTLRDIMAVIDEPRKLAGKFMK